MSWLRVRNTRAVVVCGAVFTGTTAHATSPSATDPANTAARS
ncbi:hypothetical protein [Yinghuangia sp. ASG 101]|nr:hypothetical protein [Yinghuangia sp. ASG 101]